LPDVAVNNLHLVLTKNFKVVGMLALEENGSFTLFKDMAWLMSFVTLIKSIEWYLCKDATFCPTQQDCDKKNGKGLDRRRKRPIG
jgi:hypothetical protein